jgi:hypothetical protein
MPHRVDDCPDCLQRLTGLRDCYVVRIRLYSAYGFVCVNLQNMLSQRLHKSVTLGDYQLATNYHLNLSVLFEMNDSVSLPQRLRWWLIVSPPNGAMHFSVPESAQIQVYVLIGTPKMWLKGLELTWQNISVTLKYIASMDTSDSYRR